MYCKNCGRELKDGTRFCDRCGQSVKQSNKTDNAIRRKEIEALKEERLNRKRKMAALEAEKEKKKAQKKLRKKNAIRRNQKLVYVIAAVLIILLSAIISYIATRKSSENAGYKTRDESIELNSTPVATIQTSPLSSEPEPTFSQLPVVNSETENSDPVNEDGYRVFEITNNISFPYPSSFIKKSAEGDVKLNAMDAKGGAVITLTKEKYSGPDKAYELMKEYTDTSGGTISYSRAGNDWYAVTSDKNNIVYHRKCLIVGDMMLYYDFSYDKSSVSVSQYEDNISYIDEAFAY